MKMSNSIAVHHRYICIFVCSTTYLIFVTFGFLIFIHEQILLRVFCERWWSSVWEFWAYVSFKKRFYTANFRMTQKFSRFSHEHKLRI